MAVDYVLKIDGIEAESTDDKHKEEIELESFSWGVNQTVRGPGAGEAAAGWPRCRTYSRRRVAGRNSDLLVLPRVDQCAVSLPPGPEAFKNPGSHAVDGDLVDGLHRVAGNVGRGKRILRKLMRVRNHFPSVM